ncbi:MAG: bifunctional 4-hydroxy-2-oxoglutarate aldolase/2-dehydro-3-deoxy-phosphogluconate aldolase [Lentisphaeria bacterium]|nr:bifunctional 4-hydroxy-2-oxoglutarate aldolase/2-dehydro-3-deoxy-phosphogluconate aldolase [Lentisphaeria bacterium]
MFSKLRKYGIVPVVAVDSPDEGLHLCEALIAGGLPVAEITFRTDAAEAAILAASKRFPEMILGAGTVLTAEQLERAAAAGACFAVAPGCNPTVMAKAVEMDFPFAPGVCTPSDVERAVEQGLRFLKFFPAEAAGGLPMLKSLIGPYGHLGLGFCPTGGVNRANMMDYLSIPQVAFVGGTWVAKKDMIKAGDWAGIRDLVRDAVEAAAQR